MAETKIKNVPIKDLLFLLSKLNRDYDLVNFVFDDNKRTITVEPVIRTEFKAEDPLTGLEDSI